MMYKTETGVRSYSLAGELGVEARGHLQHGQVLGGDAAVLPRHVRVQRVAGLRNGTAEDATVENHGIL